MAYLHSKGSCFMHGRIRGISMNAYCVTYEDLSRVTAGILAQLGYSEDCAALVSKCLVEADARHLHSHGVALLPTYQSHLEAGSLKLDAPAPAVVFETPISAVIDGHSGVGFSIADFATRLCIEKTKRSGLCAVTVRNANHYGFAGYWTEMIAEKGLIGITATNTVRCVCPTGSAERSLGTNPISVAFPTFGDEPMFLLDMATCVMAHGKFCRSQVFAESGIVPEGVLIDGEGRSVVDFKIALDILTHGDCRRHEPNPSAGGLLPLGGSNEAHGGHKGYGLALLVELLTGGLAQGMPSRFIPRASEGICFFFMAIAPALFGNAGAVRRHIAEIVREYRQTVPIDPNVPVLIPGDKERAFRERALQDGIELSREVVEALRRVAAKTEDASKLENILTKG